jgi:hypothetical protein
MKRSLLLAAILASASAGARAQPAPTAPPPVAAPAPAPAGATPPAAGAPGAPAPVPAGPPGTQIVTGQAPVVGGNAAGARERALDDAIKHAVELSIADVADPATRAAQAKTIRALLARARSFVPRYRTLEEGEAGGIYSVHLEAEVDEGALRARLERPVAVGPAPVRAPPPAVLVVAADKREPAVEVAAALAAALSAGGGRARVVDEAAATPGPAQVPARVTAEIADEGPVRGTSRVSVACHAVVRLAVPPPAAAPPEIAATSRTFTAVGPGERPGAGHADCAGRLAADLAPRVAAAVAAGAGGGGGDLRAVTVDADVVEPAAVPALLRSLRSVGAVSAVELTRLGGGRADLRVETRAATGALANALSRDAGPVISLSDVVVAGDVIHLRARLRAAPVAPGGSGGGGSP